MCIQARPISTNPRSMEEECEYGLPSGSCFTARRLEVVTVAGLLWIYFVVCFFSVWWDFVFFFFVFFTSNAHGLMQVRDNLASFTSLLVMRQGQRSEATETVFCLYPKKPLRTGVRTGWHHLISLSVGVCGCLCVHV